MPALNSDLWRSIKRSSIIRSEPLIKPRLPMCLRTLFPRFHPFHPSFPPRTAQLSRTIPLFPLPGEYRFSGARMPRNRFTVVDQGNDSLSVRTTPLRCIRFNPIISIPKLKLHGHGPCLLLVACQRLQKRSRCPSVDRFSTSTLLFFSLYHRIELIFHFYVPLKIHSLLGKISISKFIQVKLSDERSN